MQRHSEMLSTNNLRFWGPGRTRKGPFASVFQGSTTLIKRDIRRRDEAHIRVQLESARRRGTETLVLSDENMLGSLKENLRTGSLYPGVGLQVGRLARVFLEPISAIMISPRSLDCYWSSALAFGVARGHPMPMRNKLTMIAGSPRGWRDVITDIATALPGVPIRVMPFEIYGGRPDAMLRDGAQFAKSPQDMQRKWMNKAPTLPELRRVLTERGNEANELPFGMERWNPFTNEEHAALREVYADDNMWLRAGADGLATLTEDDTWARAGKTLPTGSTAKGHDDEHREKQMARPG